MISVERLLIGLLSEAANHWWQNTSDVGAFSGTVLSISLTLARSRLAAVCLLSWCKDNLAEKSDVSILSVVFLLMTVCCFVFSFRELRIANAILITLSYDI